MTAMISEVYAAFKEANVSDETARKAAESVAGFEARFADLNVKIERIEGRANTLSWMVGANIGVTVLVLGGLGAVWSKMADLSAQLATVAARLH